MKIVMGAAGAAVNQNERDALSLDLNVKFGPADVDPSFIEPFDPVAKALGLRDRGDEFRLDMNNLGEDGFAMARLPDNGML
jgi:hypothetical protein